MRARRAASHSDVPEVCDRVVGLTGLVSVDAGSVEVLGGLRRRAAHSLAQVIRGPAGPHKAQAGDNSS